MFFYVMSFRKIIGFVQEKFTEIDLSTFFVVLLSFFYIRKNLRIYIFDFDKISIKEITENLGIKCLIFIFNNYWPKKYSFVCWLLNCQHK